MKREATSREKAILFALAAGQIETWQEAFILARDEPEEETRKLKNIRSSVTHWKQHPVTQTAWKHALERLQDLKDNILIEHDKQNPAEKETEGKGNETGDNKRTKETKQNAVDYYDPKNQRTQINRIIQEAQDDPKTQLDAIKAIQQTQRDDRQAAREGKTVRVYLPLTCDTCPLAVKARGKAQK